MGSRKHETNKRKYKKQAQHSCKTKRRFRDMAHAKRGRKNIPIEMRIYECKFCKGYHLTSQVK